MERGSRGDVGGKGRWVKGHGYDDKNSSCIALLKIVVRKAKLVYVSQLSCLSFIDYVSVSPDEVGRTAGLTEVRCGRTM